MIPRAVWLGLLACSCTAGPPRPPPSVAIQPGDTAITDVSVVAMSSDGVLAHHTIVIRGDRIVAVAPTSAIALPSGIRVIDGAGKWLMPGLADMHVHTWYDDDLTLFLAAGVTTVRNMWGVEQHLRWRSQIARGERLGPTLVTSGALIDGDPPDWPGSLVLRDPADAEQLVIQQKAAGYDFLKSVSKLSAASYEALIAAARRHGMTLAGHVTYAVGVERSLAAHQRSIEHLDGYPAALVGPGAPLPSVDDFQPWLRAVLARLDPARLPALIDQTIAAGTWNCPTLIVYDRMPELYSVAAIERRATWLDTVPAAVRARWAHDFAATSPTDDDSATLRAFNAQLARITAALAAANAPLLVGTDTGGPYVIPGESLHDEIELMVAAGVPRPQVIRAATADAWRFLGQPHEAGVVEVGARADLILTAVDPLAAPLPLVPDGVMVRGRWLPRAELQSRLAEIVSRSAHRQDGFDAAPPLAVDDRGSPPGGSAAEGRRVLIDGKLVRQARYDMALAGTTVAQERVAVGAHMIAGQLADLGNRTETSYRLGRDTATVTSTYHTMTLEITGKLTAGKLVVTGHDLTGQPVSLSAPVPAGAFLSVPGLGESIRLADQLAGLPPGARRTLTAVTMDHSPAIAIGTTRYDVARKPDRGGQRVFAVVSTTLTGELVVDGAGLVSATLGPPSDLTITRRP
jgi:imidazolonepropionase-like amidohydrolase